MLKLIIADESKDQVNALTEKLTSFFPELDVVNDVKPRPQSGGGTIMLQSAREVHFIQIAQIVHVTGDNNYSIFTLLNRQKITVAKTLREYEAILESHHFYRIHKSYIINLNCLVKINKGLEFSVLMSDGAALEVASRRRTDFLKKLQETCL